MEEAGLETGKDTNAIVNKSTSKPAANVNAEETPTAIQSDEIDDPDFDDLDDVLDQFSAAQGGSTQSKAPPAASGPGRPETSLPKDLEIPQGPGKNESEEEFMARLTAEMETAMTRLSADAAGDNASPEDMQKIGKELEEFTRRMEEQGVQPEDLLKAILGEDTGQKVSDSAHQERERRESGSKSRERPSVGSPDKKPQKFEDTIRKTMERIDESSTKATTATQSTSEEDMLAQMLRALESDGGDGDGDLSKMFLGMMEQLTNKDMLYEPMAELNQKFPQWLSENKSKLKTEDYQKYCRQQVIVKDIVAKFEEKNYSDDDPKCREFIWEKMQKMQEEGAPPEDLVTSPFPGMDMPGPDSEGLEESCPTQ